MDTPRVRELSEVRLSTTRTACLRRGATVALLAALSAGLVNAGPATAATPPSVPSPLPVPTGAAPTLQGDQPPVSVGDGTVRVGPVSIDLPDSIDLPKTVEHVGRTVHRVVRTVGTVVGTGTSPGTPSSPPSGSGPGTSSSGAGSGGTSTPTGGASTAPLRGRGRPIGHTRVEAAAAGPARADTVGVAPRDRQQPATTSKQDLPRRPGHGRTAAPEPNPGAFRHFTHFASTLFHPGPTVLLLMAFTVLLALLVLLMLISVGRRTDPRIAASTDRLRSSRSTH